MRLPAPGTARRKRDPAFAGKEAQCGGGGAAKTPAGGFKVKTEPTDEDDLAAMSFAGIRHLSDMLVDGDQMEFEQVMLSLFLLFSRTILRERRFSAPRKKAPLLHNRVSSPRVAWRPRKPETESDIEKVQANEIAHGCNGVG
jgi:hypothetical protein